MKATKRIWAGRVISALPALLMLLGGLSLVLIKSPSVTEPFVAFGYSESLITPIAILEIVCAVIYVIPRTAVLGAVLVTGYLGGATATHVRISDPSFVGPIITGILVWLGLYLRDDRLRAFLHSR